MRIFLPFAAGLLGLSAAHAQYCTSGGPSSVVDSNVQLVRLVGQSDSIHHIGCPGVTGVQNLTNLSTTLVAGNTYTLQVQFGTCNGNYLGSGEIWIDYDQSTSFDPFESVGTWTGTPPVALSVYTLTVPATAHNGPTRMRVMQREGSLAPPLDPCGAFSWGSVMDFTIVITGGINCIGYTGDRMTDPVVVPALPYVDTADNSICYTNQNPAYPSPDIFYRIIPTAQSAAIHASLCGSSFDTFLSAVDKNGNVLGYNDDGPNCAPQSELTFSTVGADTVYVIVEGWGTAQGTFILHLDEDLTGVNETEVPHFSLFPNPAKDGFRIGGNVTGSVRLVDVLGNTVATIADYRGGEISTDGFAPGVYFVQFVYAGHSFSEKLIVTE